MKPSKPLLAISFLLLTSSDSRLVFAAAALYAIGNGTMWPTVQGVLSRATRAGLQGATQGYAGAASSLASILGLLVGGMLFERIGTGTFVAAAAILVASAVLAVPWVRRVSGTLR